MLDVVLPDVWAYDILPQMRTLVGADVVILVSSAYSDVRLPSSLPKTRSEYHLTYSNLCGVQIALVQLCKQRGADAYLFKPLRFYDVLHLWQHVKVPSGMTSSSTDDLTRSANRLSSSIANRLLRPETGIATTTTVLEAQGLYGSGGARGPSTYTYTAGSTGSASHEAHVGEAAHDIGACRQQ